MQKIADSPARTSEAILDRLQGQVSHLLQSNQEFDQQRLHQEAVLLATKADIAEELDRLGAHIAAARELLQLKEPAGRRFEFLTQEFNREANTICSKSNDAAVTEAGLALKTVIDRLREQVQNVSENLDIQRRGLMLVLSSPSGAGKTTIARELLQREDDLEMSISVTSRKPRPGEIDGEDYIFVAPDAFTSMRDREEFLEWALVFDNFYGTPRKPVEKALEAGRDVLFDIDWQGAEKLRRSSERDLVTVFLLPPSAEALSERLKARAQDSAEVVARRMAGAANEIQHWDDYNYVIVNSDIENSVAAVQAILAAERLKLERQSGLTQFVRMLQHDL